MKIAKIFALIICGLFFFSVYLPISTYGYYATFARLTYVQGDVQVERANRLGLEAGEVNLMLISGDRLLTEEGLAEVGFGRNNYLRIDRYSMAEVARLPETGYEDISIYLHYGRFYLRVSYLEREKEFSLHTPDASFYVLEEGLYRFEVDKFGRTQAAVFEGILEAAGETESVILNQGEFLLADRGRLAGSGYFSQPEDEFEDWNRERDYRLSEITYQAGSCLPEEIREYEPELSANGRWVYEHPYGYVWVPVVAQADWLPYYYGRWVWYPRLGWTWVSAEPWGWVVYHYGRWHWRPGLGWYWIPTVHWGPAWVHWYWDGEVVAWCPLSYWNRPVVIINNYFYDRYDDVFYPVRSRALVIVKREQLQAHHGVRLHLRPEVFRVEKIRLQSRPPQIKPATNVSPKVPGLRVDPQYIQERKPAALSRSSVKSLRSGSTSGEAQTPGKASVSRLRPAVTREATGEDRNALLRNPGTETEYNRFPSNRYPAGKISSGILKERTGVEVPAESPGRLRMHDRLESQLRENYSSRGARSDEQRTLRTGYSRNNPSESENLKSPVDSRSLVRERPAEKSLLLEGRSQETKQPNSGAIIPTRSPGAGSSGNRSNNEKPAASVIKKK